MSLRAHTDALQIWADKEVTVISVGDEISGWKDWLIPDSIQNLAKEMLPGLKKMRGQITEPLTRAAAGTAWKWLR